MSLSNNKKKLDSYSILICSKYFQTTQDFINIICVNSKFKETTEKLRFNPIPIKSLKLFPKIQTQYLYSKYDKKLKGIDNYEIWYEINYNGYLKYKENNIKCHNVAYSHFERWEYREKIPSGVNILGYACFGTATRGNAGPSDSCEIIIPSSIKSIDDYCFRDCYLLESITLPSTLTLLGFGCFENCRSLESINFPSLLTKLGNGCFFKCKSLTSIDLPSSLTLLGNYCFDGCSTLSSINLPTTLISLGEECFKDCSSLTSIALPSLLTEINKGCFFNCISLELINIPSSLTEFGEGCFYGCDLLILTNSDSSTINSYNGFLLELECGGVVPYYCFDNIDYD
ncbi:hypothetical protein QTN25_002225 [Entamoeba marina]